MSAFTKKKLSREVKIGIYGVSMILLLYLGINYIKGSEIFSRNNTYYATFDDAAGLVASSPVEIRGYRVGTVETVWYDLEKRKVVIEFSVKKSYPLPVNSLVKITSTSLLGSKILQINLGDVAQQYHSGDTVRSVVEKGLMELASSEYDKLKEQASSLVQKLNDALEGLNNVLSERNVANISATLENLNALTGNANQIVEGDLKATIRNVRQLSDDLRQTAPKIDQIAQNVAQMTDTLQAGMPLLMSRATGSLDRLEQVLVKIDQGEGSAGKLVNDQQLYENLVQVSSDLSLLVQDIKENPGRYIHLSVFGGNTKNKSAGQKSKEPKELKESK